MQFKIDRIAWLEKPKKQKKLTATLGSNKKLLFSNELYERLPDRVRFGFGSGARALVIAKSEHDADKKHKNGTVCGLTEVIRDTGMKLPICFEVEYDTENEMWVGEVILRKKKMNTIWSRSWHFISLWRTSSLTGSERPLRRRTEGRLSHWLFVRRRGNIQRRAEILKLI